MRRRISRSRRRPASGSSIAQIGAELARRLISIQRERLVGSQVLDRKTRRVLHDEILPALHADLLALYAHGAEDPESARALADLAQIHRRISQLLIDMPHAPPAEEPIRSIVDSLRRLIADELKEAFDGVRWEIDPRAEEAARNLPPVFLEVWFYAAREAIRNAAKYGRGADGSRPLHLKILLRAARLRWNSPSRTTGSECRRAEARMAERARGWRCMAR